MFFACELLERGQAVSNGHQTTNVQQKVLVRFLQTFFCLFVLLRLVDRRVSQVLKFVLLLLGLLHFFNFDSAVYFFVHVGSKDLQERSLGRVWLVQGQHLVGSNVSYVLLAQHGAGVALRVLQTRVGVEEAHALSFEFQEFVQNLLVDAHPLVLAQVLRLSQLGGVNILVVPVDLLAFLLFLDDLVEPFVRTSGSIS